MKPLAIEANRVIMLAIHSPPLGKRGSCSGLRPAAPRKGCGSGAGCCRRCPIRRHRAWSAGAAVPLRGGRRRATPRARRPGRPGRTPGWSCPCAASCANGTQHDGRGGHPRRPHMAAGLASDVRGAELAHGPGEVDGGVTDLAQQRLGGEVDDELPDVLGVAQGVLRPIEVNCTIGGSVLAMLKNECGARLSMDPSGVTVEIHAIGGGTTTEVRTGRRRPRP